MKQQAVSDVLTSSDVLVNGAGLIAHSSGAHSSDSEDSEDSVVGEHSPFVRHTRKTYVRVGFILITLYQLYD